ncbi:MAG: ArnT family glycosyltransferase [Candidatus Nanoarchaeia archaeon]
MKNNSSQKLLCQVWLAKNWIYVLLVIMGVFYLFLASQQSLLLWDEPVYLSNAQSHLTTTHFTEDFRFPGLEYVLVGAFALFGSSIFTAQIVMIVFSLLGIFAFYLLAKELFAQTKNSTLFQLIATLSFAIIPPMIFWSFRIYTDIPSVTCMLFSIYFFIKSIPEKKASKKFISPSSKKIYCFIALAGIFASLSFLLRFSTILFVIPIGIYLLYNKRFKHLLFFSAGALATLLPWLLYNTIQYSHPLWDLLAQGGAVASYTAWQPISILFNYLIAIHSLFLLGLPLAFYQLKSQPKKQQLLVWILVSVLAITTFFYFSVVQLKLLRYSLMFIPFTLLLSVWGISRLQIVPFFKRKKYFVFIFLGLCFLILIAGSFSQVITLQEKASYEKKSALYQSIHYAEENIPQGEMILSNNWVWFGYYGNHQVMSLWDTNITNLITVSNASTVIYFSKIGVYYNQSILDSSPILCPKVKFKDSKNISAVIYEVC